MTANRNMQCPTCADHQATLAKFKIDQEIVASKKVIIITGFQYHALEEILRPVFSEMPTAFDKHFDASFLRYSAGFTLICAGEDNPRFADLLEALSPLVKDIVAFGRLSHAEEEALERQITLNEAAGRGTLIRRSYSGAKTFASAASSAAYIQLVMCRVLRDFARIEGKDPDAAVSQSVAVSQETCYGCSGQCNGVCHVLGR